MKVTLVLDEADADRLALLADLGLIRVMQTGANLPGDRALIDRIHSARRYRHARRGADRR